ncbi:MAG: radical SAM protein [Adlercreutzia equolifaciens]
MSGTAPCETPESFPASPADGRTRIGIKVQDGCDNACTYCIVHVARGRATSRPADEVVAEAVALAESGVREVVAHRHQPGLLRRRRDGSDRPMSPPSNGHRRSARRGRASLPLPHRLHRAYGT